MGQSLQMVSVLLIMYKNLETIAQCLVSREMPFFLSLFENTISLH